MFTFLLRSLSSLSLCEPLLYVVHHCLISNNISVPNFISYLLRFIAVVTPISLSLHLSHIFTSSCGCSVSACLKEREGGVDWECC